MNRLTDKEAKEKIINFLRNSPDQSRGGKDMDSYLSDDPLRYELLLWELVEDGKIEFRIKGWVFKLCQL